MIIQYVTYNILYNIIIKIIDIIVALFNETKI